MIWGIVTSVATVISMVAFIVTALYVRAELKALDKDRYLTVTNQIFSIWQSREFMADQLWLLHTMQESAWEPFVQAHRADNGEIAFHRVGSFYDRVGTLAKMDLIDEKEILSTIGGYAIAVWNKIEPLVREARRIENSMLFDDFERLLPACYECYVPALVENAQINPFQIAQPVARITPKALKERLDRGEPITILDVRQTKHADHVSDMLPGSVRIPPDDVEQRFGELPQDHEVVAYCA